MVQKNFKYIEVSAFDKVGWFVFSFFCEPLHNYEANSNNSKFHCLMYLPENSNDCELVHAMNIPQFSTIAIALVYKFFLILRTDSCYKVI